MKSQRKSSEKITTANNQQLVAESIGDVNLRVRTHSGVQDVIARNALYVPNSTVNLLSVSQMVRKSLSVHFTPQGNEFCDDEGNNLGTMSLEGGIYKLDVATERNFYTAGNSTAELWHRRIGHLNYRSVMELSKRSTTGISVGRFEEKPCISYIKRKITRKPFSKDGKRANEMLELIHSDLYGPMEEASIGGSKYFMTLTDDFSRKVFVYFLEKKSQVRDTIEEFKTFVEKQTGKPIKSIRTDNGREYVNRDLENFLRKAGIRHQQTVPYSPKQNDLAERINRTIVERAKSMMFDAELPKRYWAEAVATAVYLINRSSASGIDGKTLEEIWTGQSPNLQHLRVFGYKAMAQIPKERRQKWDSKQTS